VISKVGSNGVLDGWAEEITSGNELRCAVDQVFSPVAVEDVADAVLDLAEKGMTGLFNVAGSELISRYSLAEIFITEVNNAVPGLRARVVPCALADINFKEARPLNTSLDVSKICRTLKRRPKAMKAYITEYIHQRFAA
jgi:dTDP-4-dehydrorhamnose reductase